MKTTYTKDYILENKGCYSAEDVELLFASNKWGNEITLEQLWNSDLSYHDLCWFFPKMEMTKEEAVAIAINEAEAVLPIFEKHYPNDDRPRKAIDAAKSGDANAADAARAAYAADAARAAYAADAARAANAVRAASGAAVYASYAAADAAGNRRQSLWTFIKDNLL